MLHARCTAALHGVRTLSEEVVYSNVCIVIGRSVRENSRLSRVINSCGLCPWLSIVHTARRSYRLVGILAGRRIL